MTDHAIDKLLQNLDHAMIADRHRLRRQLHELRKRPDEAKLAQLSLIHISEPTRPY